MPIYSTFISNELAILVLLSRPHLTLAQRQELRQRIQSGIDKAFLQRLFEQHKVWGCAYDNVSKYCQDLLPIELIEYLEKKYQQGVKCNRVSLKQFFQITHAFKQAGISLKTLKGIPLAQRLYQDIAKRHFKDIDLLIQEKDLAQSNRLLNQLGYRCEAMDKLPASMMPVYFSVQKDLNYCNDQGSILELHIRLSSYSSQFSTQFLHTIFSNHNFNKSWDPYEEFIYLSWHGSQTLYHRLKWLCDIALIIEQGNLNFQELYRKASLVSKRRAITNTLILCHHLYTTELPQEAENHYYTDRFCRQLVNNSLSQLELQHTNSILISFYSTLSSVLLSESYQDRSAAILHPFKVNYTDIKCLPCLPSWLHFTYYFARPITFIWRRVIRRNNKAAPQ